MGTTILHWGMALDDETVQIVREHGIHTIRDFLGITERDLWDWGVLPEETRILKEGLAFAGYNMPPGPVVFCKNCQYYRLICENPFCLEHVNFLDEETYSEAAYCRFYKEAEFDADG